MLRYGHMIKHKKDIKIFYKNIFVEKVEECLQYIAT